MRDRKIDTGMRSEENERERGEREVTSRGNGEEATRVRREEKSERLERERNIYR